MAKSNAKGQVIAAGLIAAAVGWNTEQPPYLGIIHERESAYHRISVIEEGISPHKRRLLSLDSTQEGGMNPETGELILPYQEYWKLALLREPAEITSALFIGAGAFGMPENVSRDFPKAAVDVVEIDPEVIDVGRKFFKLDEHPRVTAHAADARRFLHLAGERKWDMIFGDAYNGRHAIPSHLATREFFQMVADHLEPRGVYVMNIISAVNGRKSDLTGGMIATLRQVFPSVEVFAVGGRRDEPQNIVLFCSRENLRPLIADRYTAAGSWQERLIRTHLPGGTVPRSEVVFTDDYNPVDAIIARGLLE
jgi:spermidine synthase